MGFEEAFQAADLAVRSIRTDGLRDIERVVLEGSWYRQTYQTIAAEAGYTEGYLSRDVGPALWILLSNALGMQVKKTNFRTAIERWSKMHPRAAFAPPPPLTSFDVDLAPVGVERDAPSIDVTDFRGRESELADLTEWILHDRGRLLCLSGMPGVGKTWLAVKLSQCARANFQRVIYRDLSDLPTPVDLMMDLLQRFHISTPPNPSLQSCLDVFAQILSQKNSLIILDGTEVFCCPGRFAGVYDKPFEEYGYVLETLAAHDHQSCIFWVGRELPRSSAHVAGSSSRLHAVEGLNQTELSALAFWPSDLFATDVDWQYLRDRYGGLPFLMQGIVPRLPPFANNLAACLSALEQDSRLVRPYLEAWLAPLSEIEWHILTWLTISCEALSLSQLSDYLGIPMPLAAIESLCDRGVCRSLVHHEPRWELALPELLSRYVCDRFIETFQAADETQRLETLHRYPLVQSDAPETVRQWQKQTILQAIAVILSANLPLASDQEIFLQQALQLSRKFANQSIPGGYSAGNLINLAQYWQVSLVTADCQGLVLREADLQSDCFQGVAFTGADFSQTLLAKPLGQAPVIAISPDQKQVAVGDQDGRLLLWNIQDGRLQRAMFNVPEAVAAITFSDDGCTLAEGRQDGRVRLWDLRSEYGPELFTATAEISLRALAFSPDKQLLAGGDEAGDLYVWRLASGEQIHCTAAHEAAITAITFSPCSRWLTTCGQDCAAVEWEAQTGKMLHRFQGRVTSWLGTVLYLPTLVDSGIQAVVAGRDEGQIVIWDIQSARPLRVVAEPCDMLMALALSPNGRYLAASDVSNTLSVWDVSSKECCYQISDVRAPIESLVFSPNSKELMAGCDYTVQLWKVKSGQCLRSWRSDRHPAVRLALATTPLQLLSGHDDQTLRCWRPAATMDRWLPHERLQVPSDTLISAVATSAQGGHWALGTEAGIVHVWQGEQRQWLAVSIHLPRRITALALSPNGHYLAAGDATGTVALWSLTDRGVRWQKNQTHADKVMALAFSPDSQRVFTGSRDRTVQGWDDDGNFIVNLAEHRRRVHTLCVSGDGKTLYSGSYDGTVRCWDVAQQTCIQCWQQSDRLIHAVTRDDQNRPLAIVSDTKSLEIWDLDTNTCRISLPPQDETIWHVSVCPDGQSLVSASQDGEINIWSLTSGHLQGQLRVDRPYEGMRIGGCTGLTDSEQQMLYSLGATDY